MIVFLIANLVIYYSMGNPKCSNDINLNPTKSEYKAFYNVYYVYKDAIALEKKELFFKNDTYHELISLYRRGEEDKHSDKSKMTDIKIKSYRVYNNVLYIELSDNIFYSPKYDKKTLPLYIQSFVNTITQTNKDVQVQFLLNNKIINETIKGVDFSQKFKWRDDNIILFDDEVYAHLQEFLNYVIDRNYELAYAMLSLKDRSEVSYSDFVILMNNYANDRNNTLPIKKTVTKDKKGYKVVISYDNKVNNKEEWHLIEKNNKTLLIELNANLKQR